MRRSYYFALIFLLSMILEGCIVHQETLPYLYKDHLRIPSKNSQEAIEISANIYTPILLSTKRYPAVIFPNSWGFDEYEYKQLARELAKHNYIVLSYSARGWGESGGQVDVGGVRDRQDIHAVIDWLIKHEPVDPQQISMVGISYGGGLALLGAEFDSRIKAIASLSGWTDLYNSFYNQKTPSIMAMRILISAAKARKARLSPEIYKISDDFNRYQVSNFDKQWAIERSPITYVNRLDHRNVAIYMNTNYQDILFSPSDAEKFYQALKINKKRLDLSQGNHAVAEAGALSGHYNKIWSHVESWLDSNLKNNRNINEKEIGIFTQNRIDKSYNHYVFSEIQEKTYLLKLMKNQPMASPNSTLTQSASVFTSGTSPFVIIELYRLLQAFKNHPQAPTYLNLSAVTRSHAIFYFFPVPLEKMLSIEGQPRITLTLKVARLDDDQDNSALYPVSGQLIGYLYDVDPTAKKAELITYAPITWYSKSTNFDRWQTINLELNATNYQIMSGHYLALGIGTEDALFKSVFGQWHKTRIIIQGDQAALTLPVLSKK